tara:strand:- start:130 stop:237 length:108 start_codon:yes stop_codon:yes gene_type:complete
MIEGILRERIFNGKILLAETYCYKLTRATGFEPAI